MVAFASGRSGSMSSEHRNPEISYAKTVLTPQGLPLFSYEPAANSVILEDQVEVESSVDERGMETHKEIANRHSSDSGGTANIGEGFESSFDAQEQEQGPSTPMRRTPTRTKRLRNEASATPTVVIPNPDIDGEEHSIGLMGAATSLGMNVLATEPQGAT